MNKNTPIALMVLRGLTGIATIGVAVHLVLVANTVVISYLVISWSTVFVLVAMLLLSWTRIPFAAYALAVLVSLLPISVYLALWLIVLRSAPVWEFALLGVGFMALPIALSMQIVRGRLMRRYFHFPATDSVLTSTDPTNHNEEAPSQPTEGGGAEGQGKR